MLNYTTEQIRNIKIGDELTIKGQSTETNKLNSYYGIKIKHFRT